jgi:hypothetical protein
MLVFIAIPYKEERVPLSRASRVSRELIATIPERIQLARKTMSQRWIQTIDLMQTLSSVVRAHSTFSCGQVCSSLNFSDPSKSPLSYFYYKPHPEYEIVKA